MTVGKPTEQAAARPDAGEAAGEALGFALQAARQAAGLTQAAVAARLGRSLKHVKRIERHADRCTPRTLHRYVQALGEGFALEVKVRWPEPPSGRGQADLTQADERGR